MTNHAMEEKNRHNHPVFIMTRDPRPSDRETRMYPPPGKWIVRARGQDPAAKEEP